MNNLNDLSQEFITKTLGNDIKVSFFKAMDFYGYCEENNLIPIRLKELSEKIKKACALENRLSDRFQTFCHDKKPESLEDIHDILLSYEDLFEYPNFISVMKFDCRGKYFHKLNIDCSLKFVSFWLQVQGLVSEKTFQELEAMGTEKNIIDELKQINEKNILCKQSNHWPSPWN